jgi:Ca2+:H+ antiporter
MKNKLDLSMGIAVGSACQISIFVIPCMVVVGWMIGKDMSLNFGLFESFTMFLAVVMVVASIKDGKSNYLTGLVLIAAYFIIAAAFMARNDQSLVIS